MDPLIWCCSSVCVLASSRTVCRLGKKVGSILSHLHSWMCCLRVQIRPSPPPRLRNTICPFDEANQVESYRMRFRIRILQLRPISTRPPTQRPLKVMLSFTSSSTSRSRADLLLPDTGDRQRIWLANAGTLKKFLEKFKQKQQCQEAH